MSRQTTTLNAADNIAPVLATLTQLVKGMEDTLQEIKTLLTGGAQRHGRGIRPTEDEA